MSRHADHHARARRLHFAHFGEAARWTPAPGSSATERRIPLANLGPETTAAYMADDGERHRIERTITLCHDSAAAEYCGFPAANALGSTVTTADGQAYLLAEIERTDTSRQTVSYRGHQTKQARRAARHHRPLP